MISTIRISGYPVPDLFGYLNLATTTLTLDLEFGMNILQGDTVACELGEPRIFYDGELLASPACERSEPRLSERTTPPHARSAHEFYNNLNYKIFHS